ncbi:fatty acid desaturase 6 isoform X2 [Heterodontus francisci]|uniref:fatty acid desaturase 6 isoform X2 n=1 Tax=Heterodontus francisci TaxID=7792 RepID=UPI00355B7059
MELAEQELAAVGESRMQELTALVQKTTRGCSWWERHGVDWACLILALSVTPAGFLLLRSKSFLPVCLGILLLGTAHTVVSVKGSHLASHSSLSESKSWSKFWAVLFIEVFGSFTAEKGIYQHVKLHHAYTNVMGLGDSSTWKLPFFPRYIYLFILPLAVPVITPIVAIGLIHDLPVMTVIRTLSTITLGMWAHCWLLIHLSGFQSLLSAFLCMLLYKASYSIPYIHVNIFQVKPIVSNYFKQHNIPYNEDSYLSRLRLFIDKYEELMVDAPQLTELVGIQ